MKLQERIVPSRVVRLYDRLADSEGAIAIILAVVIGAIAGLGAVGFRYAIQGFQWVFFKQGAEWLGFMGDYYVIVLPVIGGLIIGPLIYILAREAEGEGPPEVMRAVMVGGGRIRARVAAVKILVSSICIGSGGAVGREGPIVQIGSSVGSAIGQWLKLPEEWLQTLVLCGAAGGISATFNAPIGGVFFAMEVLSHRLVSARLFTVMISAIVAEYVAWIFLGSSPSFNVEEYSMGSYWEIIAYIALGILAGFLAIVFIRLFFKIEDVFKLIKIPIYLKAALGGLFVGIMGYSFSLMFDMEKGFIGIFGVGYGSGYAPGGALTETGPVDQMLSGEGSTFMLLDPTFIGLVGLLIALACFKMVTTSITLGSGGSGGVFAPSLFIGAALGATFGILANDLFPTIISDYGAYSIVGMGAFFAAMVQGPLTAIVLLIEMTRDIELLLPLMAAVVFATLTARALSTDSIYTLRLQRQGIEIHPEETTPVMRKIAVSKAMTIDYPVVPPTMPVDELITKFSRTAHHGFPVVDDDGRLVGVVTLSDVEAAPEDTIVDLKVEDIASTELLVAYPDQSLHEALYRLGAKDIGRILVVDRDNPEKLLGVLRRSDIIKAYRNKLVEDSKSERAFKRRSRRTDA